MAMSAVLSGSSGRAVWRLLRQAIQNLERNAKILNDKAAWIRRGILQDLCPVQCRATRRIRNIMARGGDILADLNLCLENPLLAEGFYRGDGMTIFKAKKLVEMNATQVV